MVVEEEGSDDDEEMILVSMHNFGIIVVMGVHADCSFYVFLFFFQVWELVHIRNKVQMPYKPGMHWCFLYWFIFF